MALEVSAHSSPKRLRVAGDWLRGQGIQVGADSPLEVPAGAAVRRLETPISELPARSVDFVIAAHGLERSRDPLAALREFERVLKPGGVIYLALPDQRRNPDHDGWRPDAFLELLGGARQEPGLDFDLLEFAPPEDEGDEEFIVVLGKGDLDAVRLPASRRADDPAAKRLRLAAWLQGAGIEIGALHNPLRVPPTASVRYVDHLPVPELRRHYPELNDLPLVQVDLIGSAEDLSGVSDSSVDFVIANHLLEHLEDPIAGLAEFHRVLRAGGIVYLALPDKRLTFDRERQLTPLSHLVDEHRRGTAPTNRRDHYLDWARNVDKKGPESEAHAEALLDKRYSIHFHVWRPETFLEFLFAARREAGIEFELVEFSPPETEGDIEFILILAKGRGEAVRLRPSPAAAAQPTPPGAPGLRQRLATSPLGPPVRAARRLARRLTPRR
jgi:ubiquinone/menaquinone biosynthesis C-methylase UbiE